MLLGALQVERWVQEALPGALLAVPEALREAQLGARTAVLDEVLA